MQWHSLETAPTETMEYGDSVFLFIPGHGPARARYAVDSDGIGAWISWERQVKIHGATHYMQLPAAPNVKVTGCPKGSPSEP